MGPYFIDFEGFQHGAGEYCLKELCIMSIDQPLFPLYYLFEAPRKWQDLHQEEKVTYSYVTNNYHELDWDEGQTRYCSNCIMNHVQHHFPYWQNGIFYVMETQNNGPKYKFLKQEFPELNLVNYNITFNNLPTLPPNISCLHRNHGPHCAFLKCLKMVVHYTSFK